MHRGGFYSLLVPTGLPCFRRGRRPRTTAARVGGNRDRALIAGQVGLAAARERLFKAALQANANLVVLTGDRGLCGGLNSQMFRRILADMREWQEKGVEIDVVCIGQKATVFFRRLKVNLLASVTHLGEKPELAKLVGVIKVMLDGYTEGKLDRVFLSYNDFINTMAQKPRQDQLLPLPPSESLESRHDWDYLYEPDAQAVLEHVRDVDSALVSMASFLKPGGVALVSAGGLSLKIFTGVMIGVGFYGLNKLFAHLGMLNTWPPIFVAALPSLVVLALAMTALYWIERR